MGKLTLLVVLAALAALAGAMTWPHGGVGLLVFGVVSALGAGFEFALEAAVSAPALQSEAGPA